MQGKFATINYGRTFNLGNYESSRIDITYELGPKDKVEDVFQELFYQVEELHDIELEEMKPKKKR